MILLTMKMYLFFYGDDLTRSEVNRAVGAHDPAYLTRSLNNHSSTSTKGKGVVTSSATFAPSLTHQVPVHDDDEIEEDIDKEMDLMEINILKIMRLAPFTTRATSSATSTPRSTHQALTNYDDGAKEDIGEDEDYGLDGDNYCKDCDDLE
ncbi:hypothetical protein V6N12_042715 [Hibiscus sabdariffa]